MNTRIAGVDSSTSILSHIHSHDSHCKEPSTICDCDFPPYPVPDLTKRPMRLPGCRFSYLNGIRSSSRSCWNFGIALVPIRDERVHVTTSFSTRDVQVKRYEASSGAELRSWKPHPQPVAAMAVDASGCLLATASADRSARVWDVQQGHCTHAFRGHKGASSNNLLDHGSRQGRTAMCEERRTAPPRVLDSIPLGGLLLACESSKSFLSRECTILTTCTKRKTC